MPGAESRADETLWYGRVYNGAWMGAGAVRAEERRNFREGSRKEWTLEGWLKKVLKKIYLELLRQTRMAFWLQIRKSAF